MAFYTTSEFKSGLKVIMEGDPYSILENVPVKPGKGQAFNRVKLRNLKTGRVIEMTFKSGEGLPGADVVDVDAQYLYNDGNVWHFMMPDTFEQFEVSEAVVVDAKSWLKEQDTCVLTLWNGVPLAVTPPNQVILKVIETDPGLRGDTSSGGNKPATMETGVVIRVPLFVQVGDLLKVDTRTGNYISRAKE